MSREAPKDVLDAFCIDFCKVVEKHCPYIIVSGFIVISTGRMRGTEDIDMIIPRLTKSKLENLHNDLLMNDFICMQTDSKDEIYEYLQDNTSVRYTRKNRPFPEMEIKFAKDELDEIQLQTRQKIALTGLDVWFGSVDMNIAFKEEYLKSQKDLEDATHLRTVFKEQINEDEIRRIKRKIRELRL